jgi:Right handed beta helix region
MLPLLNSTKSILSAMFFLNEPALVSTIHPANDTFAKGQGGCVRWKPRCFKGLYTALLLTLLTCFSCTSLVAQSANSSSSLSPSGPIVINGQDGTVIEGLKITSSTGDCVLITNSRNITIQDSEIGPCRGNAVKISGGDTISIFDSYIHPETLNTSGCCDHNDGILSVRMFSAGQAA